MSELASNSWYVKFDSIDISAYIADIKLTPKHSPNETSAGANRKGVRRAPGLTDNSLSVKIIYDTGFVQSIIQKLAAGYRVTVEYGMEGMAAGKPKHIQDFFLDGAPISQDIGKSATYFGATLSQADEATFDMYAGSVY